MGCQCHGRGLAITTLTPKFVVVVVKVVWAPPVHRRGSSFSNRVIKASGGTLRLHLDCTVRVDETQ